MASSMSKQNGPKSCYVIGYPSWEDSGYIAPSGLPVLSREKNGFFFQVQ